MKFIDLEFQQKRIQDKIESNIKTVLDHGQYIMGPEIAALENTLNQYIGSKHAISCSSGTDALFLSLLAYNIVPGDAIITTPFTFIATAEVISLLGATPVFVDIDPKTFNIDPDQITKKIIEIKATRNDIMVRGIIAVDLFGLPADYDRINAIAKEHNLFVIEDAAQSFGAVYKGKKACSLGDVGCASFFPAKPLGCYGDGGMCFTDNPVLAEKIGSLRVHGKGGHKYDNIRIGSNSRLDTIQAAILLAKFEIFPEEITLRQQVASRYQKKLSNHPALITPYIPDRSMSIWAQYSILAKNEVHRKDCMSKLKNHGIPTAVYYPKPLHLQGAFEYLQYREGELPVSENIAKRIFSLPMHPYLTEEEQEDIIKVLSAC
ncbi:MAG: DegT/DnrJ/EryC1/StrS family aminotransferase [Desulfobacteraceae bacterium]|nr:MAG: DegT/DnrJ/EryC1/StrS family aminotransferase [Desulfobacteraceae bacterium]